MKSLKQQIEVCLQGNISDTEMNQLLIDNQVTDSKKFKYLLQNYKGEIKMIEINSNTDLPVCVLERSGNGFANIKIIKIGIIEKTILSDHKNNKNKIELRNNFKLISKNGGQSNVIRLFNTFPEVLEFTKRLKSNKIVFMEEEYSFLEFILIYFIKKVNCRNLMLNTNYNQWKEIEALEYIFDILKNYKLTEDAMKYKEQLIFVRNLTGSIWEINKRQQSSMNKIIELIKTTISGNWTCFMEEYQIIESSIVNSMNDIFKEMKIKLSPDYNNYLDSFADIYKCRFLISFLNKNNFVKELIKNMSDISNIFISNKITELQDLNKFNHSQNNTNSKNILVSTNMLRCIIKKQETLFKMFEIKNLGIVMERLKKQLSIKNEKVTEEKINQIYQTFLSDLTRRKELLFLHFSVKIDSFGNIIFSKSILCSNFQNQFNALKESLNGVVCELSTTEKLVAFSSEFEESSALFDQISKISEVVLEVNQIQAIEIANQIKSSNSYISTIKLVEQLARQRGEVRLDSKIELEDLSNKFKTLISAIRIDVENCKDMNTEFNKMIKLAFFDDLKFEIKIISEIFMKLEKSDYHIVSKQYMNDTIIKLLSAISKNSIKIIEETYPIVCNVRESSKSDQLLCAEDPIVIFNKYFHTKILKSIKELEDINITDKDSLDSIRSIEKTITLESIDYLSKIIAIDEINNNISKSDIYNNYVQIKEKEMVLNSIECTVENIPSLLEIYCWTFNLNAEEETKKINSRYFEINCNSISVKIKNLIREVREIARILLERLTESIWMSAIDLMNQNQETTFELKISKNIENSSKAIAKHFILKNQIDKINNNLNLTKLIEKEFILFNSNYQIVERPEQTSWLSFISNSQNEDIIIHSLEQDIVNNVKMRLPEISEQINEVKLFLVSFQAVKNEESINLNKFETIWCKWKALLDREASVISTIQSFSTLFAEEDKHVKLIQEILSSKKHKTDFFIKFLEIKHELLKKKWKESDSVILETSKWIKITLLMDLSKNMKSKIDLFNEIVIIFENLKSSKLEQRHFSELRELLSLNSFFEESTLLVILESNLYNKKEQVQLLTLKARGELLIKQNYEELNWYIRSTILIFESNDVNSKIMNLENIKEQLIDKMSICQSFKSSPNSTFLEDKIQLLEVELAQIDEIVDTLSRTQSKIIKLSSIFLSSNSKSSDIIGADAFLEANHLYTDQIAAIQSNKRLIGLLEVRSLLHSLQNINKLLEKSTTMLYSFLEHKRMAYPRLFFLGDNDLCKIVNQPVDQDSISLILKLFSGIKNIEIKNNSITNIQDSLGEAIQFDSPIPMGQELTQFLNTFEKSINLANRDFFLKNKSKYNLKIIEVPSIIQQHLVLINWLNFYNSFSSPTQIAEVKRIVSQNIDLLTDIKMSNIKNTLRSNRDALLLNSITQRDIVQKTLDLEPFPEFYIFSLLKYELSSDLDKNNDLIISIGHLNRSYGWEFIGQVERLVRTDITEKCFLSFAEGLAFGYVGAPFGPAGTGKTETVKELGHSIGKAVVVFNCDEGNDLDNIRRLLIGVVGAGVWGCFDEFNRIRFESLSSICQMIIEIQNIMKVNKSKESLIRSEINGKPVVVSSLSALFITLNPASEEYTGRSHLPDNFKSIFRSFALIKPDVYSILKVSLVCAGFKIDFTESVSRILVSVFNESKIVLSNEQTYDWGLRSLKSIIRLSSFLKQQNYHKNEMSDAQIISKAVEVNVSSRLLPNDKIKFKKIFDEFFNEIQKDQKLHESEKEKEELNEDFKESFENLKLVRNTEQIEVLSQIVSLIDQTTGLAILGKSGSGKTTLLLLLKEFYKIRNEKLIIFNISPKSIGSNWLYGHYSKNNAEFNEGVFITILRQALEYINTGIAARVFIVFEGGVDSVWIESLNSCLDDNKLFSLPTGERLMIPKTINLLLETENLDKVSPATISRLGIVRINLSKGVQVKISESVINNWNSFSEEKIKDIFKYQNEIYNLGLSRLHSIFNLSNHNWKLKLTSKSGKKYNNDFYCNRMTTFCDFINYLSFYNENKDQDSLEIYIHGLSLIKPDQFNQSPFQDFLIFAQNNSYFYDKNKIVSFLNIKVIIVIEDLQSFKIIGKRLLNRLYIDDSDRVRLLEQIKNFENQKEPSPKNDSQSIYDIVLRRFEINSEDLKRKIKFLKNSVRVTKSGAFSAPLNKDFFKKAFKVYQSNYRELDPWFHEIWPRSEFMISRFEKLILAMELPNINSFIFVSEPTSRRRTSVELVCSFIGIRTYYSSSVVHLSKTLISMIQEILEERRVVFVVYSSHLEDHEYMSKIDSLINFRNFSPFQNDIIFHFEREVPNIKSRLNEIFKKVKFILIWNKHKTIQYENLAKGYISLQKSVVPIVDYEITSNELTSMINNDIDLPPNVISYLQKNYDTGKVLLLPILSSKISKLKNEQTMVRINKLSSGLEKFSKAVNDVYLLERSLTNEKKELMERQDILKEKIDQITYLRQETNSKEELERALEKSLEIENQNLLENKNQVTLELSEVQPLIDESRSQIQSVSRPTLDELRCYKVPPECVIDIFTAIMKLMGEEDTSWTSMKKFLGRRMVLDQIAELDPRNVKLSTLEEIEKLVQQKKNSFDYEKVSKFSLAAVPISQFVKAILKYVRITQNISPLESELKKLTIKCEKSKKSLADTKDSLKKQRDFLMELELNLNRVSLETEELRKETEAKEIFIQKLSKLMTNLKSEEGRWTVQQKNLKENQKNIPLYSLIASYYILFLSGLNANLARNKFTSFVDIFENEQIQKVKNFMIDSNDSQSLINKNHINDFHCLFMTLSLNIVSILPKVIYDPEGHYTGYILKNEQDVEIINSNDNKFMFKLELAIKFGKQVALKTASTQDSDIILQLLRSRRENVDKQEIIKINGKVIQCHKSFSFIVITENSKIIDDISVMNCNFTTAIDLTKKIIINVLLNWRNPKLNEQSLELEKLKISLESKISKIEDEILSEMVSNEGNFVENNRLFEILEKAKTQSIEFENILKESETNLQIINNEIKPLQDTSVIISEIFILIEQLSQISTHYSVSLNEIVKWLNSSLTNLKFDFSPEIFIELFASDCCKKLYCILGKSDYIVFVVSLMYRIGMFESPSESPCFYHNLFSQAKSKNVFFEILFMNRKNKSQVKSGNKIEYPILDQSLYSIADKLIDVCPNLHFDLKKFTKKHEFESSFQKYTIHEKIFVSRYIIQNHLIETMKEFVFNKIGTFEFSVSKDIIEFLLTNKYSFVFYKGFREPTMEIESHFNLKPEFESFEIHSFTIINISKLESILNECLVKKTILVLKDFHLIRDFSGIVKCLSDFTQINDTCSSRIIITCNADCDLIDFNKLQSFQRLFLDQDLDLQNIFNYAENAVDNINKPRDLYSKLSLFHALLVDRSRFTPFGFLKDYEFTISDLLLAKRLLVETVSNNSYQFLKDLVCQSVYQGKITDKHDKDILERLFKIAFSDEMTSQLIKDILNNETRRKVITNINSSVIVEKKIEEAKVFIEKIKHLNNLNSSNAHVKVYHQNSNKEITKLFGCIKKTVDMLISLVDVNIKTDAFDFFIFNEISTMRFLLNRFNEILEGVDDYLNDKIFISEIKYFDCLSINKTPREIQLIWSNDFNLTNYLNNLQHVVSNFKVSFKKNENQMFTFDLAKILNIERYMKTIESIIKGDCSNNIEWVLKPNKTNYKINDIKLFGGVFDKTLEIKSSDKGETTKLELWIDTCKSKPTSEDGYVEYYSTPIYNNKHKSRIEFRIWVPILKGNLTIIDLSSPFFYIYDF